MAHNQDSLLKQNELKTLKQIAENKTDDLWARRARVLILLNDGVLRKEAAQSTGFTYGQATYIITAFRKNGMEFFKLAPKDEPMKETKEKVKAKKKKAAKVKTGKKKMTKKDKKKKDKKSDKLKKVKKDKKSKNKKSKKKSKKK